MEPIPNDIKLEWTGFKRQWQACIDDLTDGEGVTFNPGWAGQPGASVTFTSLTQCIDYMADWLDDALYAMKCVDPPDYDAAGYAVDSIRLAMPQFSELAGLDE